MQFRFFRRDGVRAALFLVFLLNVCFFPCIWGDKTLLSAARDTPSIMPDGAWAGNHQRPPFPKTLDEGGPGFQSEPWFALVGSEYLHDKTFPIWNPYEAFGKPLAADMQSQPFYPLTALLAFRLTPRTYNWYILLRLFIAGFCMYLYLRFFAGFIPAIGGAAAAMLSGYYILFITMPQLSVETMLPAALLAGEYLLRRPSAKSIAAFAGVVFLTITGGMPESTLLLLSFTFIYLCFRIVSDPVLRAAWLPNATRVIVSSVAGFALAALLLLPFIEFLHLSLDTHQPSNLGGAITGLRHDRFDASIWTYVFPLIFGPPFSSTLGYQYTGVRNYFGIIAALLILLAVAGALRRRGYTGGQLKALTWFSFAFFVFDLLKRYGVNAVNQVGRLPFFQMVWFGKYDEALMSICVAILCALGLERLLRRDLSGVRAAIAFVLTSYILLAGALYCRPISHQQVVLKHIERFYPRFSVLVPSCLFLCAGLALLFFFQQRRASGLGQFVPAALLSLVAAEFCFNFIVPVYYLRNFLPKNSSNPYAGAPYITALQQSRAGHYRIVARQGFLFPDWACPFRLEDIRDVDAMYYKKYFPFLTTFLPGPPRFGNDTELGDRFNGTGDYDFESPLQQRLLQLSSTKYLAGPPMPPSNKIVDAILGESRGHLIPGREANINRRLFDLNGEAKDGLGEHPPYERLPYQVTLPDTGPQIFHFSYALDPAVFDKTGDGVGFTIEVQDAPNHITKVFYDYIDPKHNPAQRRWVAGQIDLSAYRGKTIQLLFSTDPGPKGDTSYDWAAWADFSFNNQAAAEPQPFRLIHTGDAFVYAFDNVLPRAAIYYGADLEPNAAQVLKKLADPSLDVFRTVVLDSSALSTGERAALASIPASAAKEVQPATIVSYEPRSVGIDATLDSPGILVLNDSDYPGWKLEVDGHPARWFTANYIFRGVLLSAGRHTVQFHYAPASFRYGGIISLVTLCGLIACIVFERRRNRVTAAAEMSEAHLVKG